MALAKWIAASGDENDTNDICWVCKCHTGGAANWPGKMENLTRFWEG